jgi:S1-C subfamily serine protease
MLISSLHRIFCFCAALVLAARPVAVNAASPAEKIYRKILPSVATLEVETFAGEQFVGSAVLALADDVAVTAWHVVADARTVWATFPDGQRIKVLGCLDQDSARDLALLKLEKALPRRQAALGRTMQPVAARAYVIGAPKGYDFSISDGLISQIRRVDGFPQYQLSCPISPGNSGSPVLNDRGQVIAIASWTKTDAQNVSFATPIQELKNLDHSRAPKTWAQLAASGRPALPARVVESHHVSSQLSVGRGAAGGLVGYQQRLAQSAGKPVTVIVQEGGQTNKYTFTVPRNGLE